MRIVRDQFPQTILLRRNLGGLGCQMDLLHQLLGCAHSDCAELHAGLAHRIDMGIDFCTEAADHFVQRYELGTLNIPVRLFA